MLLGYSWAWLLYAFAMPAKAEAATHTAAGYIIQRFSLVDPDGCPLARHYIIAMILLIFIIFVNQRCSGDKAGYWWLMPLRFSPADVVRMMLPPLPCSDADTILLPLRLAFATYCHYWYWDWYWHYHCCHIHITGFHWLFIDWHIIACCFSPRYYYWRSFHTVTLLALMIVATHICHTIKYYCCYIPRLFSCHILVAYIYILSPCQYTLLFIPPPLLLFRHYCY